MITLFTVLALGFVLGMRHATDPDHVIAVTTILSRQRGVRNAVLIGALWGVGHTITIFSVGSAIILFGIVIPPRVGLSMELSVGVMLILLGVLNLTGIMRRVTEALTPLERGHTHSGAFAGVACGLPHIRGSAAPVHGERDAPAGWLDRICGGFGVYHVVRPLAVGLVHGLAGSAAIALLVLTTIRTPLAAVLYLLVFGLGTITGMMLITTAIAVPIGFSQRRFSRLDYSLGLISGLVSVSFGLFIVYEMGYVNGLFTHSPNWIPR